MKRNLILILVFILQTSCTYNATPSAKPTAAGPVQTASAPTPAYTHKFEVVTWFSDPEPELGARTILYGSLLKDGIHLGGMAMRATWPDEDQERGVPNCSVQVIYGSGVCIIESEGYQAGVTVPVTVTFEYQGKIYRGTTAFTLR